MNSQKISGGGGASNNNSSSNNNNNTHLNHNHHSANSHSHNHGHNNSQNNASPILPITPSTSVSPPINVICKKEITSASSFGHNTSAGSGNPNNSSLDGSLPKSYIEAAALHQHQQQQLQQHQQQQGVGKDGQEGLLGPMGSLGQHHNSNLNAYAAAANLNARLGQSGTAGSGAAGNLTPLGSNSSIMTTPSPPITPQAAHNPLSYVPNHESYNFWHNQYNQYPNNYQTPSSYYTQMDYFNNQTAGQANYNMGHSGYTATNFGLAASGAMTAQTFSPNGLDYMSPQDKYVNMV